MSFVFVYLIALLLLPYASAQQCEQCETSKAAFFATNHGLSSGACGYRSLALDLYSGHVAAARQNIYQNGQGCGACYQIRCENKAVCSKNGTNIVVTDFHNAKTNFTDFVLSNRAFRAMALPGKDKQLLGIGIVNVEYKRVPCVYKGKNLAVRVEEFSKPPNYLAIKVLYQGGQTRIVGAELARVDAPSNWITMNHNYGAVWDTSAAPKGALQFRFIIYSGFDAQYFYTNQVLPAKWKPGVVYESTAQIDNVAIEKCKACKGFKL